jgi:hypothetical protein
MCPAELSARFSLIFVLALSRSQAEPLRACAFALFFGPKISRFFHLRAVAPLVSRACIFALLVYRALTFALPVSFRVRASG